MVGQGEVLGVGPVVGDVSLVILRVGHVLALLDRVRNQIELVHPAAVDGHAGGRDTVTDIDRESIWCFRQLDPAASGQGGSCSIGSGESPEEVVKGVILADDDDDVLDDAASGRAAGIAPTGGIGATATGERNAAPKTEKNGRGAQP